MLKWIKGMFGRPASKPTGPAALREKAAVVTPLPRRSPIWLAGGKSYRREVAGEANYHEQLLAICGGYSRDGYDIETVAELRPEPDNPHDPSAVRVCIRGGTVGYLPREDARRFTADLAKMGLHGRTTQAPARIRGGWRTNQHDAGNFGVYLNFSFPLRVLD